MEPMLEKLQSTQRSDRWGIGTAGRYVREISTDAALIRAADETLVYCDPDLVVEPKSITSAEDGLLSFTATITSTRIDRDSDVLHCKGATIDPRMPLLWAHDSSQPVGVLAEIVHRDDERIAARFVLADVALSSDIKSLLSIDALRMSIGFLPSKYSEREDSKGNFLGWEIEEYEILETSLVAVPSNVDCLIDAAGGDKLCHPMIKSWVTRLHEQRPARVGGGLPSDNSKRLPDRLMMAVAKGLGQVKGADMATAKKNIDQGAAANDADRRAAGRRAGQSHRGRDGRAAPGHFQRQCQHDCFQRERNVWSIDAR